IMPRQPALPPPVLSNDCGSRRRVDCWRSRAFQRSGSLSVVASGRRRRCAEASYDCWQSRHRSIARVSALEAASSWPAFPGGLPKTIIPAGVAFLLHSAAMNTPTTPPDPRRELQTLLASRLALIVVESREESRVLALVREMSLKVRQGRGWGVFQWTVTEGLQRIDIDLGGPQRTLADPEQLLKHLKATSMPGIYVLLDFHPYLKDPVNVRLLKDIAQGYDRVARTVVFMSYEVTLPEELQQFSARLHLALPTTNRPLRSSPMSAVCRICGTGWPAASRRSTALPRNWIRPKACSCWGCRVAARVWPRALRALG